MEKQYEPTMPYSNPEAQTLYLPPPKDAQTPLLSSGKSLEETLKKMEESGNLVLKNIAKDVKATPQTRECGDNGIHSEWDD